MYLAGCSGEALQRSLPYRVALDAHSADGYPRFCLRPAVMLQHSNGVADLHAAMYANSLTCNALEAGPQSGSSVGRRERPGRRARRPTLARHRAERWPLRFTGGTHRHVVLRPVPRRRQTSVGFAASAHSPTGKQSLRTTSASPQHELATCRGVFSVRLFEPVVANPDKFLQLRMKYRTQQRDEGLRH